MDTHKNFKQCIGDAVYANFDGYCIVLTTENGISTSNTIALEPSVLKALDNYILWLKEEIGTSK